jgi:hypothetical protein
MSATIESVRRYYLLRKFSVLESDDLYDMGQTWRAKQEAVAGTSLPSDFPHLSTLQAVGYSTKEDLTGADSAELVTNAGLNTVEATSVLAALEEL